MKKINLIIASLLLVSGVLFYACTKDDNTNNSYNSYNSQNKSSVNKNEETRGIERLFDEEYVQQLITISGIDPKKLSQDFAVWNPFYHRLRAVNACFLDKYLYFLENSSINGNAAYCLNHLNLARDYFAVGDTINGLTAANQAYAMADCGSLTPFFYQGHSFDIPASQIAQDIKTFQSEMEILINKYPKLNKIDEQYKMDILTLAIFYSENGDTKAPSCRTQYNMECSAALLAGVMCSEACVSLIWPPAIIAGQIACATICTYALYTAYDKYRTCSQQGN